MGERYTEAALCCLNAEIVDGAAEFKLERPWILRQISLPTERGMVCVRRGPWRHHLTCKSVRDFGPIWMDLIGQVGGRELLVVELEGAGVVTLLATVLT